jgi:hypothetical protein
MSVGQLILSANWIVEGNYRSKFRRLLSRKGALLFLLIFTIHLLGLLHTENFAYALKDIRIKLPLFVIPFILASSRGLQKGEMQWLLMAYTGAVVCGLPIRRISGKSLSSSLTSASPLISASPFLSSSMPISRLGSGSLHSGYCN